MKYCTNCGKETASKKICEHCGVQIGTTRLFCAWCGQEVDGNASVCPGCGESTKSENKALGIIGWIVGVILILAALGSFAKTAVAAICLLIAGVHLLPVVDKALKNATHTNLGTRKLLSVIRIVAIVVLVVIGGMMLPRAPKSADTNVPVGGTQTGELSNEQINALVAAQLNEEIEAYKKYESNLDPDQCKYKISKTDDKGDEYVAYGNGYFYDKYGKICEIGDASGFTFEVTISKDTGKVKHCKFNRT